MTIGRPGPGALRMSQEKGNQPSEFHSGNRPSPLGHEIRQCGRLAIREKPGMLGISGRHLIVGTGSVDGKQQRPSRS